MVSFSELVVLVCKVVLTIVAYSLGYYFKLKTNDSIGKQPCPINPTLVQPVSLSINNNIPKCVGPKVYDHCVQSYGINKSFLHVYKSTHVAEELFPDIHHPNSPAKSAYILSGKLDWNEDSVFLNNCNNVYFTRTGQRANQPNKCAAIVRVPEGLPSILQISHRVGTTALKTNQYMADYFTKHSYQEEIELLAPMLRELHLLKDEFIQKMGSPLDAKQMKRTAVVMVANEGVLDLLLNFICSSEGAGIDLNNIMVFVGEESTKVVVESMGAHAMYAPALGSMPKDAAKGYLDATFARMMWFKVTSVYLGLISGFNVLFQDVDLVWLRDPVPYLQGLEADIAFMDDGARTPRYTPFFVNSGFYFMKNNPKTVFFMEKMLKSGVGEIATVHSHQSTLIHYLSETTHLLGLKTFVLDQLMFASGQAYHENKPFLKRMLAKEVDSIPFVFHMCWTDNRENKVVYFKDVKLWFLSASGFCATGADIQKTVQEYQSTPAATTKSIRDSCCQRAAYWDLKGMVFSEGIPDKSRGGGRGGHRQVKPIK